MLYPEIRHVVNGAAQSSDSGTYRYTLPRSGALHAVLVKVLCTNGGTEGHTVSIFDALDDVRLIANGHKYLFNLTPEEIEKFEETLTGDPLQIDQDEQASAVQSGVFPVKFGRALYDPQMYLPLERFETVELELDYSPTISATAGFATGTFTIDLTLIITPTPHQLPYLGTLVTRRIKDHTTVASGEEATEIHRAWPLRAIGVYCYEAAIEDGVDVTKIDFEANDGQLSLLSMDWSQFIEFNREHFGAWVKHTAKLFIQNNDVWSCRLSGVVMPSIHNAIAVDTTGDVAIRTCADAIAGDQLTFDVGNIDITAGAETITADTTDRLNHVEAEGLSPSYFGLIPFLYNDVPEGYLKTTEFDKLEVILTQGAAGGQVYVSVQELQAL